MRITKLGHCCLLLEVNSLKILTDPGMWSTKQDELVGIDIILITHEHKDHLHIESLKNVLKNNPRAKVITNNSVMTILHKENILAELLTDGMKKNFDNIIIEGCGLLHAEIYSKIPSVENTGYFIDDFFYPGDALTIPNKKVRVLALPVAGPWIKTSEAIEYGLLINPEIVFPVHDGMLIDDRKGAFHLQPKLFLEAKGIKFHSIDDYPLEF